MTLCRSWRRRETFNSGRADLPELFYRDHALAGCSRDGAAYSIRYQNRVLSVITTRVALHGIDGTNRPLGRTSWNRSFGRTGSFANRCSSLLQINESTIYDYG